MTRFKKFKRKNNKTKRKIIKEYNSFSDKTEYNEALRLVFSFIYSHIFAMAKDKKIYVDLDLTDGDDSKCISILDAHLITISRKQIKNIYALVEEDKVIDDCYKPLLGEISYLPLDKQFAYPMNLYKPTILITAIYLIYGHETTHAYAAGSKHLFNSKTIEEKQCDTSSSSMIINLYKSILATFKKNQLLTNVPIELFEGVLIMNIMIGVLIFTKYITSDRVIEAEEYLPHEDRRILYLIGTILALPLHSYTSRDILCRAGVIMYSMIFETNIQVAENTFNNVAKRLDKLNN